MLSHRFIAFVIRIMIINIFAFTFKNGRPAKDKSFRFVRRKELVSAKLKRYEDIRTFGKTSKHYR